MGSEGWGVRVKDEGWEVKGGVKGVTPRSHGGLYGAFPVLVWEDTNCSSAWLRRTSTIACARSSLSHTRRMRACGYRVMIGKSVVGCEVGD